MTGLMLDSGVPSLPGADPRDFHPLLYHGRLSSPVSGPSILCVLCSAVYVETIRELKCVWCPVAVHPE